MKIASRVFTNANDLHSNCTDKKKASAGYYVLATPRKEKNTEAPKHKVKQE